MSLNKFLTRFLPSGSLKRDSSFVFSHFGCHKFSPSFSSTSSSSSSPPSSQLCLHDSASLSPSIHRRVHRSSVNKFNKLPGTHASSWFHTLKNQQNKSAQQSSNVRAGFSSSPPPLPSAIAQTSFELVEKNASLIVRRGDQKSAPLPFIWLRDHCRCEACYNHDTHQKDNVDLALWDSGTGKLDIGNVALEDDGSTLVVHWKDGHVSRFSLDWLMSNSYQGHCATPNARRILWTEDTFREGGGPPSVSFESHVNTQEGLRQTLVNLLEYGFAMITEAPVSLEGIKTATDRVAPIQETFFGGLWKFTSDGSFSDTAFSNGYLAAHTDNTYLELPAGIQVFQCLSHDGRGGETLLVDGFRAIDTLRQTHPEAVRCLSKHLVPHEYKQSPKPGTGQGEGDGHPGYHIQTLCPVIRLHPATGDYMYLRFNPYDRAPLNTIPPEEISEFYHSYLLLSSIIADPAGEYWVKLRPGTILLIDNWRVMHGRAAFDGTRVMSGCYLSRDELMSKMRLMGLTGV